MNSYSSTLADRGKRHFTIGIVGVRGYVGRELIRLLAFHRNISLNWVSSRQLHGCSLTKLLTDDEHFPDTPLGGDHYYQSLKIETLSEEEVASRSTDIIVLALPNGLAKRFVDKLEASQCQTINRVIIDLSADYRFAKEWIYSVPELVNPDIFTRMSESTILKISNPGCYATAMQIALAPLVAQVNGRAHCFGVSGFSGAGTKPSDNNKPNKLKNNILAYGLIEHLHEKEVSHHLKIPISFSPHVASFFRGICMTIQVDLKQAFERQNIFEMFQKYYRQHKSVTVQQAIPNIQQVAGTDKCAVGGFSLSTDGKRLTLVSCLDNLLKGAASQALANIERALNLS